MAAAFSQQWRREKWSNTFNANDLTASDTSAAAASDASDATASCASDLVAAEPLPKHAACRE